MKFCSQNKFKHAYYVTVATGPPTDVTASDVTANSFKMSWEDLTCDDLDGETLRYSYELTSRFGLISDETSLISATFSNLRCGTAYTFRVAAITDNGVGLYSNEVTVETLKSEGKFILILKSCIPICKTVNNITPSI